MFMWDQTVSYLLRLLFYSIQFDGRNDILSVIGGFLTMWKKGGGPYGAGVTRGQDLSGKDFSGKTLIKQDFKTVLNLWHFLHSYNHLFKSMCARASEDLFGSYVFFVTVNTKTGQFQRRTVTRC